MSPDVEEEYYSIVNSFPEYNDDFDHTLKDNDRIYTGKCNHIRNSHFEGNLNIMEPCLSIARHLAHINGYGTIDEKNKRCKYFNYRIKTQYGRIHDFDGNNEDLYNKLNEGYAIYPSDFKIYKCKIESISEGAFKELKDLYNLHDKLYKIKKSYSGPNSSSSSCENADEFVQLYDGYIKECNTKGQTKFCNKLTELSNNYQAIMETKPTCKKMLQVLEPPKDNDQPVTALVPFVIILVMSILFFILYKFTPFGPWIRPQILRKKKIWKDLHEKVVQLFHNSRNKVSNCRNSELNVLYHSLGNN
ncbi:PIR Superfamily Protein [Plasmodium ovale wallikeri]|uniref:PIR Superfamily Protein n=2 Tax=Plasmodium ovale TaxID=36330 RepID=A0A1A9A682_PLAOA|nr:PIR Superfamily Protein [Plasmodium ovale wallikeri]SBT55516.1 PIR Superfamily Protein [Plasmodium ovale wallikeri]SBT74340.1 PIR protein [Plasmodium ovale]